VGLDGMVDEITPFRRERDQFPAAVRRVRLAPDQPARLEAVEALRHAARGDHRRAAELARGQPVWGARAAQRRENVEVRTRQLMLREHWLELALGESGDAGDTPYDAHRRRIEVGSLMAPLGGDPVNGISCTHPDISISD
jgi:hypothetical protein